MDKEQYVTFKVAKLLKKKGFNWEVNGYFCSDVNNPSRIEWSIKDYNSHKFHVSAPTQQMAMRWLMEEKHIFIGKSFAKNEETLNLEFYSPIFNMNTCELITTIGAFCPEDGVEGALEYVLRNLI